MQYHPPNTSGQEVSNTNHFGSVSDSLGRLTVANQCTANTNFVSWSAVAQLVECRTRNRESPGSNPVVTVSKFGHFLSLHDASVDSAV